MPAPQRVTLVSAAPARPGDLTVAMVVNGREQTFTMAGNVAAALSSDIVRALGNSLLYDAGLERAAQVVALRPLDGDLSTAEEELSAAALEIRELKIGKKA